MSVSPYAFKLYMPPILDIGEGSAIAANIIHIRSDQKVQCITSENIVVLVIIYVYSL